LDGATLHYVLARLVNELTLEEYRRAEHGQAAGVYIDSSARE